MTIDVVVAWSPAPREVVEWPLQLAEGASVMEALRASGLPAAQPGLDLQEVATAVWGRKAGLNDVLKDRDRIEVLRALKADPKTARRERFRQQGSRGAGLFAKTRTAEKPGR